jgi:hypothetical protein
MNSLAEGRQPRAWRCPMVPAPHPSPWRTEGGGLDEIARRALLALVGAPQVLLDSCVGGAGADKGQARVNRFVVIALSMPPPPSAAGCGAS